MASNPKIVQNCAQLTPNVSHVIFDMDGLLLATEELYTEAANKVSEKFARNSLAPKVVTWELKVKQMGLQKNDLAKIMVEQLDLTCTPDQYLEETCKIHMEVFGEVFHGKKFAYYQGEFFYLLFPFPPKNISFCVCFQAKLLKGVNRLIRHLHRCHVPIALATSSSREYFELKTQNHRELFQLFHHIVTGHSDPEVIQGKPFPDINLVCAKRFDPPAMDPKKCLVFEDSPNGVKAALAAGR